MAGLLGKGRVHLRETGMTYVTHLARAGRIGTTLIGAGAACLVHGLLPALFTDKASRTIIRLNEEVSHGPTHGGHQPMWLEFEI